MVYKCLERRSMINKLPENVNSRTFVDNHERIIITIENKMNKNVITSSPTPSINDII